MLDSYYRLSIPEDLTAYYHVSDGISKIEAPEIGFDSDVVVNRDLNGRVSSVQYYTAERELIKQVYYDGENICKINYYRGNCLYSTESYKNSLLVSKYIFKSNSQLVSSTEFEYNKKNKMTGIRKKSGGRSFRVKYEYDELDRIKDRLIYAEVEKILEQHYSYDILDRIIEYRDDNQRIIVNKVGRKNELISYTITDRMGNDVNIINHFTDDGYEYTDLTINGHSSRVKDTSYSDNVMLKKPYTSEDDLDLIIANLFRNRQETQPKVTRELDLDSLSDGMVDRNIKCRVLPISMRKRLLYDIALKISQ